MRTRIHVNQHVIRHNRKTGDCQAVLTVKDYKQNRRGHTAIIRANGVEVARVVYRPDNPLGCGAHCWIETQHEVLVDDKDT